MRDARRDSFDEVLKNEHQVVTNAWIMVHVKSMYLQEMDAVIVDFNDVSKSACPLKVTTRIFTHFNNLMF